MVHFFSQYIEKHRHPSRTILTGAGSCVKQHCDVGPSISLFATLLMNFCHLNAADVFEIFFYYQYKFYRYKYNCKNLFIYINNSLY